MHTKQTVIEHLDFVAPEVEDPVTATVGDITYSIPGIDAVAVPQET